MKITFPHLGNVYIAGKALFEELGHEVIIPPICSRKTLEIGIKASPEMMCLPFKIFMGNYIESIENGADTILLVGSCGPCRFGFYSLIQEDILKNLGYDVEFLVLESHKEGINEFRKNIKTIIGSSSLINFSNYSRLALKLIKAADDLFQLSNDVRAYAINKNEVNSIMDNYYSNITHTYGVGEMLKLMHSTEVMLNNVKKNNDIIPLRVGIIGEIYTIIEPFVNLEIERKLGAMDVLVDKSLTPTKWLEHHIFSYPLGSKYENTKYKLAKPYIPYMIGGHGRETVGSAIYYNKLGYDGVIQILPLNCMPEIVAKSVLKSVHRDLNFPIMTLVIDEMTGEAGFNTRLEAFVDLISKRKKEIMRIG